MRYARPLALAFGLGLCVLPAAAQTPMEDPLDARDAKRVERMEKVVRELRAIVFQGRDTGKPVVVQPAETEFQMQELTRKLDDMEQTLTRLNGALESTGRDLDLARREARTLRDENRQLAERLAVVEQRAVAPPAPEPTPAAQLGNPDDAFARARQLMLDGDYDQAEAAFAGFVGAYPDHAKAPEASYWWGKTLSVKGEETDAASAYIGAIRGWPKTAWAPDAVVELSRSLIAVGKPTDACATLGELTRRYPAAPAAVKSKAAAARTRAKCAA